MRKKIFSLNEVIRFFAYNILVTTFIPSTYSQFDVVPLQSGPNDEIKNPYQSLVNYTDYDLDSTYNDLESIYEQTQNLLYNATGDEANIQQIYPSVQQQNFSDWFQQLLNNSKRNTSIPSLNFTNMFPISNLSTQEYYQLPSTFKILPSNQNITPFHITLPANMSSVDANIFYNASNPNIPSVNNSKEIYVNIPHIDSLSLNKTKNLSNLLQQFFRKSTPFPFTAHPPKNASIPTPNKSKPIGKPNLQLGTPTTTDMLAKTIGEDIAKNSSIFLNKMLTKLGLQSITMSADPKMPMDMYKFNTSDIGQSSNNSAPVPYIYANQSIEGNGNTLENLTTSPLSPTTSEAFPYVPNLPHSHPMIPLPPTNSTTNQLNITGMSDPPMNQTNATTPTVLDAPSIPQQNVSFSAKAIDSLSDQYGEIIYSSVYFVHGSTTPPSPFPLDPYNSTKYWPEGIDQLTNDGKNQMYELGKWLQRRYNQLIGPHYNASLIMIDSGGSDVTITSAECLASGLFPPSGYEIWNRLIRWQPIPIHTVPDKMDNVILMMQPCQQYTLQIKDLNESPEWLQFYDNNTDMMEKIGNNIGHNMTREDVFTDLEKIYYYYQDLKMEEQRGLPLPNWTSTVYPDPMSSMAEKYIEMSVQTRELQKIKAGPFFKTLTNYMSEKIDAANTSTQFWETLHLYSGDFLGLSFIMKTLGVYNSTIPSEASALIFDLRFQNNSYIITVSYKNSSSDTPYVLNIPNCQPICRFDNFINITSDLINDDWEDDCATITISDLTYTIPIIIFGIVIIFILALVVVLLCMKCIKYISGKKASFS